MQYLPQISIATPFFLIALALLALYLPFRWIVVPALCVLSIALAFTQSIISSTGVLICVVLAGLALILNLVQKRSIIERIIWWSAFACLAGLALAAALHLVPGFNNPKLFEGVKVTEDAIPFTLYWNYDKAFAALAILIAIGKPGKLSAININTVLWSLICLTVLLVIVFPIAFSFGMVEWHPKLPDILLVWVFSNLFITCVAEEAYFRGLWQRQIRVSLEKYSGYAPAIAVMLASILFGLAHFPGGYAYMVLSMIAGLAYGLAYQLTNRLEAAILVHFLFNLVHLLLFTYPLKAVG